MEKGKSDIRSIENKEFCWTCSRIHTKIRNFDRKAADPAQLFTGRETGWMRGMRVKF